MVSLSIPAGGAAVNRWEKSTPIISNWPHAPGCVWGYRGCCGYGHIINISAG